MSADDAKDVGNVRTTSNVFPERALARIRNPDDFAI